MRAVIQRVKRASVEVEGEQTGSIGQGFLVYLGVAADDQVIDYQYLAQKILNLRVFADDAGQLNRSIEDVGGAVLVVSQFTLYADCRRGRRPSFSEAAPPALAEPMYEQFVQELKAAVPVETGVFQANMQVHCVNDGPVTLLLESP